MRTVPPTETAAGLGRHRRRPTYEERRPTYEERRPTYEERRPTYEERRPPYEERRPPYEERLPIFDPSHTSGSYFRSTARSFKGISALSVMWMPSGQTSLQHLVMLQ